MDEKLTGFQSEAPANPSRLDDIVDQWFADSVPNSPVARDTDAYNHMQAAKEDLKKRLAAA